MMTIAGEIFLRAWIKNRRLRIQLFHHKVGKIDSSDQRFDVHIRLHVQHGGLNPFPGTFWRIGSRLWLVSLWTSINMLRWQFPKFFHRIFPPKWWHVASEFLCGPPLQNFLLQFCRADFGWWLLQDWSLTRTGKTESELEWNSYSTRVSVLTRFPFLHSSSWILCLCAQRVVRNLSECSQQCCFDCLQHCCFDKSIRPFFTITRNYGITLRVLPRNVAQTWWGCFPVGTTVLWCWKLPWKHLIKKKR